MFHCRETELYELNKRYQRGNFECIVVTDADVWEKQH